MSWKRTLADTLPTAYGRSLARQQAEERARDFRFAQDKGASIQETMENVHDRLHPEETPPERRTRDRATRIDGKSFLDCGRLDWPTDQLSLYHPVAHRQWECTSSELLRQMGSGFSGEVASSWVDI